MLNLENFVHDLSNQIGAAQLDLDTLVKFLKKKSESKEALFLNEPVAPLFPEESSIDVDSVSILLNRVTKTMANTADIMDDLLKGKY